MTYLYGDSTASQLKSNFLEFLRDALDFCVFVLQADARMKAGRVQIRLLGEQADEESERLDRFISAVSRAVHSGEKGEPDSPTAVCGARLAALIVDAHRASHDGIRQNLADAIARIEAEEAAGRDACVRALGTLLAPHDPPDSVTLMQIELGDSGHYRATLDGAAEPALAWTLEVAIPDGHFWSSTIRVDRLAPHLEIKAPQLAGWITKEVKIKPQRIEKYLITKVLDDGDADTVTFEIRTEANPDLGFDFEVHIAEGTVKGTRLAAADDASGGPFDPAAEDVVLLVDLAKKLRSSLAGLERRPNISATFDDEEFRTLPSYVDLVHRLVATMTPIVKEISQRSLTPNELVLRRHLGDGRREEIFIAKATLREKLVVLPAETRAIFDSLGLEVTNSVRNVVAATAAAAPTEKEKPIRSELPPSVPPPRPAEPVAAVVAPAPPKPRIGIAEGPRSAPAEKATEAKTDLRAQELKTTGDVYGGGTSPGLAPPATAPVTTFVPVRSTPPPAMAPVRTLQPPHGAPPQAPVATPAQGPSPVPPPSTRAQRTSDAPMIEVVEGEEDDEVDEGFVDMSNLANDSSSDNLLAAIPESSRTLVNPVGQARNEQLVAALKKINTLSKAGRGVEAYQEYENLFSSAAFAGFRPEDQREALKLMVLAKSHPSGDNPAVKAAHRAALTRLKTLVETQKEPGDQELLGITHLFLGDAQAASEAFKAGLDLERTKNPQSELVATLMRRVSQI